jgi:hypothetical protein
MSKDKSTKVTVATDLPKTTPLTPAAIQEIATEAREWREAFAPVKTAMECITPEDLKIRVR